MAIVETQLDVDVDAETAYSYWSDFDSLPRFMGDVDDVLRLDDVHLYWSITTDGKRRDYRAEIVDRVPSRRISWRSVDNTLDAGTVTFDQPAPDAPTRIRLRVELDPIGLFDDYRDKLDILRCRTRGDLVRFKLLAEAAAAA